MVKDTREKLLKAAWDFFAEQGCHAATIQALAKHIAKFESGRVIQIEGSNLH